MTEWVRYLAFKLYCSLWAYWNANLPPEDGNLDEESLCTVERFYNLQVPETPWPSPVPSQDLSGFESEDEWEKVE